MTTTENEAKTMKELTPEQNEMLGWAIAYCCSQVDKGVDIRQIEVPEIQAAAIRDLK